MSTNNDTFRVGDRVRLEQCAIGTVVTDVQGCPGLVCRVINVFLTSAEVEIIAHRFPNQIGDRNEFVGTVLIVSLPVKTPGARVVSDSETLLYYVADMARCDLTGGAPRCDQERGAMLFTAAVTAKLKAREKSRRDEIGTSDNLVADWEWNVR